ncbi:MAG: hypothetical protein ACRC35_09920 [Angustibacter sp.]
MQRRQAASAACSACGAVVRGDVGWCWCCHADLRSPIPQDRTEASAADPQDGSGAALVGQHRGQRPVDSGDQQSETDAWADQMLGQLAASQRQPGWMNRVPQGTAATMAWAACGLVVLTVVLLLLGAVLGKVAG